MPRNCYIILDVTIFCLTFINIKCKLFSKKQIKLNEMFFFLTFSDSFFRAL